MSSNGASYFLINESTGVERWISDHSIAEIKRVVTKLKLNEQALPKLFEAKFSLIKLDFSQNELAGKFAKHATDEGDRHIVAGAVQTKAKFLITYNLRHFKRERLNQDFKILTMTPGSFLQYLRIQKIPNINKSKEL